MDKRQTDRRRTYKGARIAFDGRRASIECLVRNLSETGACLAVESPLGIPEAFDLVLDSDDSSHPCRVVWRDADRIGVAFRTG